MFDFAPQPEPDVVAFLREARALLATPEQWCKGTAVLVRDGVTAFCMSGALGRVWAARNHSNADVCPRNHSNADVCHGAYAFVRRAIDEPGIEQWNDRCNRTHAEVLNAFDRAIVMGLNEPMPEAGPPPEVVTWSSDSVATTWIVDEIATWPPRYVLTTKPANFNVADEVADFSEVAEAPPWPVLPVPTKVPELV